MMNVETVSGMKDELQKIAVERETDHGKAVGGGILGYLGGRTVVDPKTRGRVFGYKRVHHGTSPERAAKIRQEGLLRRFGGSGVAATDELIPGREDVGRIAKDKVYVSPVKGMAKQYAAGTTMTEELLRRGYTRQQLADMADPSKMMENIMSGKQPEIKTKDLLASFWKGKNPVGKAQRTGVIKADLPFDMWQDKFKGDPLVQRLTKEMPQFQAVDEMGIPEGLKKRLGLDASSEAIKQHAAIGDVDVDPKYIKGGKGHARHMADRLKDLPSYIRKHPGRFARGAAPMALGLGALGGGGYLMHRGLRGKPVAK